MSGKVKQQQQFSTEQERIAALIGEASKKGPEQLQPYIQKAAPVLAALWVAVGIAIPYIIAAYGKLCEIYAQLPHDIIVAISGLLMCFFGGMYPITIAAYEAFRLTGGDECYNALATIAGELKKFKGANKKDDDVDADNDGIADVNQIDASELMMRKSHLFLVTVDPNLLSDAMAGIYKGWVAVLAALKIRFVKTIALGAAIGNVLKKPATRFVQPALEAVVPTDYAKWIPQIINYTCKAIACSIAWFIQRVISAFHSAIRGGLVFSRGLVKYGNKMGWCDIDMENSYIDEAIGWGCAAVGFLFQLQMGFGLPWILRLVLFPIEFVEYYLMWTVSD